MSAPRAPESLFAALQGALLECDADQKCARVHALKAAFDGGQLSLDDDTPAEPIVACGRPALPELVAPNKLRKRRPGSPDGHAALLHAIAHIEFNAINLALDCAYRFRALPEAFYHGWVRVAAEEATHFGLLRERLRALGSDYGRFAAHNGLWEMTVKTGDDPLARMALVPRVLEARGLDATPPIMNKLRHVGDAATLAVLDIILRDEIGHVALGDHWFRYFCAQQGLAPEATYLALIDQFNAPWPKPPLNLSARRTAGFSDAELAVLSEPRKAKHLD
ncbi:MAG TPA: ferritin-like domain-containing protein [Denitromonas sp.]|uniref:ferritin-like domain-containing protein n=1 Tax=Denitromonas sp. TaxID=2734609 RepID=UPI001DFBA5B2|nr:ferritin-like domain-containing protein [Rhodocyclaceae bacterium]MCP5221049.1 ferritin-like domain-containing protein [Zoogloeaceae bacterium]HPR05979.1 ferritin-like domain-containing protein [Denitromonas sp.]HQU87120.1 ferritin-like domain-containing protein [Denitromonas sp.]HQV13700.1 ferritin-like domain-containing protein [Denitromonas sp.]